MTLEEQKFKRKYTIRIVLRMHIHGKWTGVGFVYLSFLGCTVLLYDSSKSAGAVFARLYI